ncbi:hypothetical protein S245_041066, partial [Arachis hypogaea]
DRLYVYEAYEGLKTVETLKQQAMFIPKKVKEVYLMHILSKMEDMDIQSTIMEREELNLNKESNNNGVGGNNSKSGGDGFIDRSKVRILLCDNDSKSSEEVFTLLIRCSYQ